jgi:DNA-binding helix-hairpin-helix protein with protein kinase domain
LIFHPLFMGRHPFAGRFLGKGDMPIEKAIYEFRFAYASDGSRTQMQPPPNSLRLSQVSPAVTDLFQRSFLQAGVNNGRPLAREWVGALAALENELTKCVTNPAHQYFKALTECPWCSIEGHAGVLLFVGLSLHDARAGFKVDLVWAQIQAVGSPGTAPLPDFRHLAAQIGPNKDARKAGWRRQLRLFSAVAMVVLSIIVGLGFGLGSGTIWLVLIAGGLASNIAAKGKGTKRKYEMERKNVETRLRALQERWNSEASDQRFRQKLTSLGDLKSQYLEIPALRQKKMQELQRDRQKYQLKRFLEQFSIASAQISHIGDTRKAMLASFGIDTAADVTRTTVDGVPGFGEFLTGKLLAWRQFLESKFVFNPSRGIDQEDIRVLDREIADRRAALESSLLGGVAELMRIKNQIATARKLLAMELETGTRELMQAQANERAS